MLLLVLHAMQKVKMYNFTQWNLIIFNADNSKLFSPSLQLSMLKYHTKNYIGTRFCRLGQHFNKNNFLQFTRNICFNHKQYEHLVQHSRYMLTPYKISDLYCN